MNKVTACFLAVVLLGSPAFAARNEKEQDRVKEAGEVLKEILNSPDDIPEDLLDKAECLIILPSVKKGAFGVGGSYGRAEAASTTPESGGPQPSTRSKESASGFNWEVRPPTLCSSS